MKIALFIGAIAPHGQALKQYLEKNQYHCINTENDDEIDQVGKQAEKAILIFTDSKFAFSFLQEYSWRGFSCLNVLWLPKAPVVTDDTKKKLSLVDLKIYYPELKDKLMADMDNFKSNLSIEENPDIEFAVLQDMEEKK